METITPQALHARITSGEHAPDVFVDVREPHEFTEAHIDGTRNIPMGDIGAYVDELQSYDTVYFICRSGGRSGAVCEALAPHGVHAVNLAGGMIAWQMQKLPVA